MHEHPLGPLLAPRSIALVGASQRPNTPGHDVVRTLSRGGYRGTVYAINPNYRTIESYPCVPTLADLPAPPDVAVLSVRNDRLESALAAGQTLILSATPPMAGVGRAFLVRESADGPRPVFVVIRVAQTQHDHRFAPDQNVTPLVTPAE